MVSWKMQVCDQQVTVKQLLQCHVYIVIDHIIIRNNAIN